METSIVLLGIPILLLLIWIFSKRETVVDPFPRTLFQTWKSKTDLPENFKYWHSTWKTNHPSWNMVLWDDADNAAFVKERFPWFYPIYKSYPKEINRADCVRYCYLYEYGGVYADMDFECLQSLDPLLESYAHASILLGSMETTLRDRAHSIPNAILISKPKQTFWIDLLHRCKEKALQTNFQGGVESLTGPIVLKEELYSWRHRLNTSIQILPPEVFYPLSWSTDQKDRQSALRSDLKRLTQHSKNQHPSSYTITYWTHTW